MTDLAAKLDEIEAGAEGRDCSRCPKLVAALRLVMEQRDTVFGMPPMSAELRDAAAEEDNAAILRILNGEA